MVTLPLSSGVSQIVMVTLPLSSGVSQVVMVTLPLSSGVSQVLSACSVFLLWKFNSPDQTVLLTCVFNAVTAPIFNMLDVIIPGLYPPQSRYLQT